MLSHKHTQQQTQKRQTHAQDTIVQVSWKKKKPPKPYIINILGIRAYICVFMGCVCVCVCVEYLTVDITYKNVTCNKVH